MIELYSAATPNGHKISIALEEMGLDYRLYPLNFAKKEQKQPEYLAINPNGRIPAIIDTDEDSFVVFESGAILHYLAEKTGQLMPSDAKGRSQVMQWLMFQMSALGPMMGQSAVFYRYLPQKVDLAIERYQTESRRLLEVLNTQLSQHQYIAGADYSIADISTWTWASTHEWCGVDVTGLDHLQRWLIEISERPAVIKGLQMPASQDASIHDKIKRIQKSLEKPNVYTHPFLIKE